MMDFWPVLLQVTLFCQGWTVRKTKTDRQSCLFCATVFHTDPWTLSTSWAVRLVLVENFWPPFSGHNDLDPHFCAAWQKVLSQAESVRFWQKPINQTDTPSRSHCCSKSVGYFKTELLEVTSRKYFVLHRTKNYYLEYLASWESFLNHHETINSPKKPRLLTFFQWAAFKGSVTQSVQNMAPKVVGYWPKQQ